MYTIAGATGQVGSAAATRLLGEGVAVRVLVRDEARGADWARRGAEVAVVDLADRAGLGAALSGSDGVFALLPFDPTATDLYSQMEVQVTSIAGAVADSGVPHVALMSSAGAHLVEGTGPIVGLHHLEEALRATGTIVSAIRSGHFQEKVTDALDAARHEGIYPVFADSADVAKPMIATRDIGEVVADTLLAPPATSEVVDLDGPDYTERQVAKLLGAALGTELHVITIPRAGWVDTLVQAGLSRHIAQILADLYDADQRGVMHDAPRGDRIVRCSTSLETTLAGLVGERG